MHQALERPKLAYNLAVLRKSAGFDHLVDVVDSGVKPFQALFEAALQAGDFAFGDSACAALASIGVYLKTAERQHNAGKETRRCAREQVHGDTHGGAKEQVDCCDQCSRHVSIRRFAKAIIADSIFPIP
jgi:hypothetical protein